MKDVFENVNTVSKRLKKAEEQLSALKAKGQPMLHNTEGLPITEILEELDEEGNVICKNMDPCGFQEPLLISL